MLLAPALGPAAFVVVVDIPHVAGAVLAGHQGAAFTRSLRATLMASPAE